METQTKQSMIKVNPTYRALMRNQSRYLWLLGSGGSGKSTFASQKLILRCINEQRHKFMVLRKVGKTVKHSVYSQLNTSLSRMNVYNQVRDLYVPYAPFIKKNKTDMSLLFPNGNQIITSGLDDVEKMKSLEGVTGVWFEEMTESVFDDFMQMDLRIRGTDLENYVQFIFSFNPVDEESWIKEYIIDRNGLHESYFDEHKMWTSPDGETTIMHTTYLDNIRFLDAQYVKVLESLKDRDPNYHRIYALGKWGRKTVGKIFDNVVVIDENEIPECEQWFYGVDYGFNNPSVLLDCGINEKENYCVIDEIIYEYHLTNPQFIKLWEERGVQKEQAMFADNAEPDRIQEAYDGGYNIFPCEKTKVTVGIDFLKSFSKVYITSRSVKTIQNFDKYKWQEDKNGRLLDSPLKYEDHSPDAARYGFSLYIKRWEPANFTQVV